MDTDLPPSKLGTKEHWEDVYQRELANFEEIGDEGEVWFGLDSVEKMVEWSLEHIPPGEKSSILEVGSGNGNLLFALLEAGYESSALAGVDYSKDAVALSKAIAATHEADGISFAECDFLNDDPPPLPHMRENLWDLIFDKGTYDAIALGEKDESGHSPVANYPKRVSRLLHPGGFFLITTCNFTEEEIRVAFTTPETGLVYHSKINHPKIMFGGQSGSSYSSVAFQKQ